MGREKLYGWALKALALALLLASASGGAWANDKLLSGVTIPAGQPVPTIVNNGLARGTIQLYYTATSCTVGQFAQFNLNLEDIAGSGTSPVYPVAVTLSDDGKGTKAQVSPSPTSLSVAGVGWIAGMDVDGDGGTASTDADLVTISITSCDGITDGSTAIANLEESTSSSSHLDTITNVNIHINFVISDACLNLYSFETNQDTGDQLTSVTVNAKKTGGVSGTSPGQASVDVLVVNTCGTSQRFDLSVGLDPEWQTNPNGNPGNATFVYTQSGELDPTTNFAEVTSLISSGTGTGNQQKLCLQNVTLPANSSYLVTVHSAINTDYNSGLTVSALPTDFDFDFGGTIFQAGSSCATVYPTPNIVNAFHENGSGYIDADDPSGVTTATSDLTFTTKQP